MRIFSAWITLIMIGCSSDPVINQAVVDVEALPQFECAVGGAKDFVNECAIERGENNVVTLRHRSGSFRKFILQNDGAIETADGSETISLQVLNDGRTEIGVGVDRYRLPVTL